MLGPPSSPLNQQVISSAQSAGFQSLRINPPYGRCLVWLGGRACPHASGSCHKTSGAPDCSESPHRFGLRPCGHSYRGAPRGGTVRVLIYRAANHQEGAYIMPLFSRRARWRLQLEARKASFLHYTRLQHYRLQTLRIEPPHHCFIIRVINIHNTVFYTKYLKIYD